MNSPISNGLKLVPAAVVAVVAACVTPGLAAEKADGEAKASKPAVPEKVKEYVYREYGGKDEARKVVRQIRPWKLDAFERVLPKYDFYLVKVKNTMRLPGTPETVDRLVAHRPGLYTFTGDGKSEPEEELQKVKPENAQWARLIARAFAGLRAAVPVESSGEFVAVYGTGPLKDRVVRNKVNDAIKSAGVKKTDRGYSVSLPVAEAADSLVRYVLEVSADGGVKLVRTDTVAVFNK